MYTLKRKGYCGYFEYYSYTIKPEDIDNFNKYFNENFETEGTNVTEQDVIEFYRGTYDGDKLNTSFKYIDNSYCSEELCEIIYEYFENLLYRHRIRVERDDTVYDRDYDDTIIEAEGE